MDNAMSGRSSIQLSSSAAAVLLATSVVSCAHSGPTIELVMYDGWKLVEKKRVRVPATTFVLSIFDEGEPHVIDDETWTYYEFSIPDDGERVLPTTFHNISGTLTVTGFRSPESAAFAGGTFTLER